MILKDGLTGENMKSYRPMFVTRRTGEIVPGNSTISLFPSEVISRQIENSTAKTAVLYKEVLTQHEVKILQSGVTVHASCNCLWYGKDRYNVKDAEEDRENHLNRAK